MIPVASSLLVEFGAKARVSHRFVYVLAMALLAPSMLEGARFVFALDFAHRIYGPDTADGRALRAAPELWRAVRDVTPTDEAIANNPLDSAILTPWPADISWALLSQRRHCAAPFGLLQPYAQLKVDDASRISEFFVRVFKGDANADDLRTLKDTYLCRTLVVTPADGLWDKPVLSNNSAFSAVVDEPGRWRIYR